MSTIEEVAQKVATEVRTLAQEYPEAVYRGNEDEEGEKECWYTRGEVENGPAEPGCIVGHAVRRAFPEFYLSDFEEAMQAPFGATRLLREITVLAGGETFAAKDRPRDATFVTQVQLHQDKGLPWGEALAAAEEDLADE